MTEPTGILDIMIILSSMDSIKSPPSGLVETAQSNPAKRLYLATTDLDKKEVVINFFENIPLLQPTMAKLIVIDGEGVSSIYTRS